MFSLYKWKFGVLILKEYEKYFGFFVKFLEMLCDILKIE